ncbi:MAG: DUF2442 domain-containing protein [Ignavibacteria bacterium]|nr:DUF2442 domain-containing protein [Ignavibacteria bacterium]
MNAFPNIAEGEVESVQFDHTCIHVTMTDGRTISVPLSWYPRLQHATTDELNNWELCGGGYGIHWEQLDEDLSIQGLLAGSKSGESQASFEKWLANRKQNNQ